MRVSCCAGLAVHRRRRIRPGNRSDVPRHEYPNLLFQGTRPREGLLAVSPFEIGIPSIVLFELEVWISQSRRQSKRRTQLDTLLEV